MKPKGEAGIWLKNSDFYVSIPNEFTKNNFFYVDRCGHYYINKHYITSRTKPIPWRFHLFYLLNGKMLLITEGREYFLNKDEMGVMDLNAPHIYTSCGDAEFMWFCFNGNCSEAIVKKICSYKHVYSPNQVNQTRQYLMKIIDGFSTQMPLPPEIVSGYVHVILSDLLSQQRYDSSQQPLAIEQAINFIETHYAEQITIKEIADQVHLNSSYLSQKFKLITGVSPKQYLINIRLSTAKILLTETNWSIREIAEQTGFLTDNYFSWYFHQHLGLTPGEYRKNSKFDLF